MNEITAVIGLYRRFDTVQLIIDSLNEQTVKPKIIHVWCNDVQNCLPVFESKLPIVVAGSTFNHGVWARLAHAVGVVDTPLTVVFDDDTIPGDCWLENCLEQYNEVNGIYGTVGIRMHKGATHYEHHSRHGWPNPNPIPIQCDFVGHSWFVPTNVLKSLWNENIAFSHYPFCGEDMAISFVAQKRFNIPTIVPPHPKDSTRCWGSTNGYVLGTDAVSIWETNIGESRQKMTEFLRLLKTKGWKWINDKH